MDRTPPLTTSNISTDWNQYTSYLVELRAIDRADTALDTPSGVAVTYWTADGTTPDPVANPTSTNANYNTAGDEEFITTFPIEGQGIFVVKFYSVDNNGIREGVTTQEVKLDNAPPQTLLVYSFPPDGSNDWYQTNPDIDFTSSDATSGSNKTYYRWNTNIFQEYFGTSINIPSEGIHTLQYYSIDVAGNVEPTNTEFFSLDGEAPLTQDDAPEGLQKDPVTINFLTSDNVSGVENTFYTTDGSTPTDSSPSGSSVTIEESGTYTIKYYSVDFAGNAESTKESGVEVFIDTEAPQTYISESFPINGTNGWYRTTPDISLLAVDPSGIKEIKYRLYPSGATTTAKYTGTIDLSATVDLTNNYNVRLEVDQSGTEIEIDMRGAITAQTTIDEIINNINTAVGETIATETNASGESGNGYITLTSPTAGTENPSAEIKFLQPTSNDGTAEVFGLDESSYPHTYTEQVVYRTYISPFQLPYDGLWQVDYYAVDNEDNQGETGTKQYKLDGTQPETVATPSFDPDGTNGWYVSTPQISLNVTDDTSGNYKTFYQWDGEAVLEYVESTVITIPTQGIRVLRYYSIDLAGNIETFKETEFKLDYVAPETTDNTIEYQGVIYTTRASGLEYIYDENADYVGTESTGVSIVSVENKNVQSVTRFLNKSKNQEYHVIDIVGTDRNELHCLPMIRNENSVRVDDYTIQLNTVVTGSLLRTFNDVLRVYNFTTSTLYSVDPGDSNLVTGELKLSGQSPINVGDELQVDYAYFGSSIAEEDVTGVDYTFDLSQEVDVLNTIEYTILTPTNTPRVHDHDITIYLTVTDNASGQYVTYYTTDGSDPKTSPTARQGTVVQLTDDGTYQIRYYSIDAAGNIEDVKDATYPIIIDKNIPVLDMSILPDPNEDGENGWFKNNFRLQVDITSDDIVNRVNEIAQEVLQYRVETGYNDRIDFEETGGTNLTSVLTSIEVTPFDNIINFEETNGVELTAVLTPGGYNSIEFAQELENKMNAVGASTYSVSLSGKKYTISSNLAGGTGDFNLLFATGTNVNNSLVDILGFEKLDKRGSSSYQSDNDVRTFYYFNALTVTTELETRLNQVGSSTYTVQVVDDKPLAPGNHFEITSDLSGGGGIFNLLWDSGVYSTTSVGYALGFDTTVDLTGSASYTSEYFKLKLDNFFVESVASAINTTTLENLTVIGTDKGGSGFYDEIIVDGNIPEIGEEIEVCYSHYTGIERVDFGLDNVNLPFSVDVYNDIDKFLGIYNDRVNFRIVFPAIDGQFFLQDGEYTIFAKAFDYNSIATTGIPQKESELEYENFKLDRVVPETTDDIADVGWQKDQAIITLTPEDAEPGSGIAATHFSIDGNDPTRLSPKIQDLPDEKIVIDQSGTYTIKYFSVDVAGNVEEIRTAAYQVFVDANAPETILVTSPSVPNGDNGWFVSKPTVSLNVTEYHSGVAATYYKLPEDPFFTQYTGPFILELQGSVAVTFYSVDNVGNIEEEKISYVNVDRTDPVTETNIPDTGWSSDPTVRFTIVDEESGGLRTHFTIDGTDPTLLSPTGQEITFQSSGTYTIKFFSLDVAGNIETFQTKILNLDLELPIVSDLQPPDGIVDETTTEITFKLRDDLSGVDISTTIFEVDGIEYSETKNSSYFSYTGTPAEYTVTIYPVQGVLNFEDIETLKIRNVQDFAGNFAAVLEFSFAQEDTSPPKVKEVYPAVNAQDVSTAANIVVFLSDPDSGVDLESVVIGINEEQYSIVTNDVLKVQYIGVAEQASITIQNNTLRTWVNGQPDISISLIDENYNTVKKVNDYIAAQSGYISAVIDSRFEQNASKDLLDITDVDMTVDPILKLFIPDNNLNIAFIERSTGYLVFVTPPFSFAHNVPVTVTIGASDNNGNAMEIFEYTFLPSIVASRSVEKRNFINRTALEFIGDMQENTADNYTKSHSTNFYGHQQAVGKELAIVEEELDHLTEDQDFREVRTPYLYEKFGYLLDTEPRVGFSHDDYRRLLLSLLEIFFKGSTKESLEEGVSLFTGQDVNIIEVVFTEGSDISNQFVFTADILIGENRLLGLNLQLISEELDKLFKLVKPAHVFILKRFIWTDEFAFQAGCTLEWLKDEYGNYILDQFGNRIPVLDGSGFQQATKNAPTAICDRYKQELEATFEEDVRVDCSEHEKEIQTVVEDVSAQFTGTEDTFKTYYSPLLKDVDPVEIGDTSDVTVTVNGTPVTVLEIQPIDGTVRIDTVPAWNDVVVVTYFYNPNYIYREVTFYLNDYTVVGNDFDTAQGSILNEQNVYDVYGGFELSSRLHAHVCETFCTIDFEQLIEDEYEVPECNNNKFFYLNDYTVDGIDFDTTRGSYLNDPNTVNRSAICPYYFFELEDKREEQIELPDVTLEALTYDGRELGFTHDVLCRGSFRVSPIATPTGSTLNNQNYVLGNTFVLGPSGGSVGGILNNPFYTLGCKVGIDDWTEIGLTFTEDEYDNIAEELNELRIETSIEEIVDVPVEDDLSLEIDGREVGDLTYDEFNISGTNIDTIPQFELDFVEDEFEGIEEEINALLIESTVEETIDLPIVDDIAIVIDGRDDGGLTHDKLIGSGKDMFITSPDLIPGILNDPNDILLETISDVISDEVQTITFDGFQDSYPTSGEFTFVLNNSSLNDPNSWLAPFEIASLHSIEINGYTETYSGVSDELRSGYEFVFSNKVYGENIFNLSPSSNPGMLNNTNYLIGRKQTIEDSVTVIMQTGPAFITAPDASQGLTNDLQVLTAQETTIIPI